MLAVALSGIVGFAVLPVMTLLRPMPWRQRLVTTLAAGAIGVAVFVVTNPYLPYNYLFHRSVVRSNLKCSVGTVWICRRLKSPLRM